MFAGRVETKVESDEHMVFTPPQLQHSIMLSEPRHVARSNGRKSEVSGA